MKNQHYLLFLIFSLSFLSCSAPVQTLSFSIETEFKPIYASAQAQSIEMDEMIERLKSSSVIFVGDIHDNHRTHQFLNDLISGLHKEGYIIHLANEWFSPQDDKSLARYVNDEINISTMMSESETGFKKRIYFDENLSIPIYENVKSLGGHLYGVNMDSAFRHKISLKQEQNMSEEELGFYSALDLDVKVHKNLVSPYFAHCELYKSKSVEACKERMYRVQVAWDSYMAQQSVKLSKEVLKTPQDKLIVFAGAMHVEYGLGIPLRFSRRSALDFKIISSYEISEKEENKIPLGLADFIFLYK